VAGYEYDTVLPQMARGRFGLLAEEDHADHARLRMFIAQAVEDQRCITACRVRSGASGGAGEGAEEDRLREAYTTRPGIAA
jgi:hypothetical protein